MRLALLSMMTLLCACASQPKEAAPPPAAAAEAAAAPTAAPAPAVEMAQTPYTAAQIRDASPAGRRIVFKVEEPGKPTVKRTIEFVKSDGSGADLRTITTDEKGNVMDSSDSHATWDELRSHAEFPKARVEIRNRTISIPMGTLQCVVYKLTEGEGESAE